MTLRTLVLTLTAVVCLGGCYGYSDPQSEYAASLTASRQGHDLPSHRVVRSVSRSRPCPRNPVLLNNGSGTFSTPGWDGETVYPSDVRCRWRVQASRGAKVRLTFVSFGVEAGPNCSYDSVAVYNGFGANAPLVGRFCDSNTPGVITSTGRSLFVIFSSDASEEEAGFRASYSTFVPSAPTSAPTSAAPPDGTPAPSSSSPACRRGGAVLTTPSGVVTSPHFSGTSGMYPDKARCSWRITVQPGNRVRLTSELFALEGSDGCVYDYLQVYDGESMQSLSLGRFCGTNFPTTIESSSNDLFIRFKSDESLTAAGFKLNYVTIATPEQTGSCGETLTEESGSLTSPNFGAGKVYPNDARCTWKIEAPVGKTLSLTFESFNLERAQNCLYDSLVVYDGPDKSGRQVGSFCGRSLPDPVLSTGRYLFLQFTSDASVSRPGFKANYRVRQPQEVPKEHPGCGASRPAVFSEAEGVVSSPSNGPGGHYPDDAFCQWRISVPDGKRAHVQFTSFELERSGSCAYDVLEVFDGADDSDVLLGRFCGEDVPSDITATSNVMMIQFKSDRSVTKPGFNISYSAKDANGGNGNGGSEGETTGEPSCGIPDQMPKLARIVGGQEAAPHSWPWQVSLRRGGHICGGSVISRQWVITAAHCVVRNGVVGSASSFSIVVGEHDLKTQEGTEKVIQVSEVIAHEQYDGDRVENDVALLRLAEDITYSAAIKPVCLPRMDAPADLMCTTTGWGTTQGTGDQTVLNQARVPIIGRETCKQPDYYSTSFTDVMICAGYPEGGKDSCQGDSGGPLVCRENGIYRLQGITSWGFGCAQPKKPGIYTRVARFVNWVDQKTSGKFQSPP